MSTIEEVIQAVEDHTGAEDVTADTKINDVVADSLEFIDLQLFISSKCGYIDDASVPKINTVHDLWEAAIGRL